MKNSPVSVVTERYQSKNKLIEAVQELATSDLWLDRVNSIKGLSRVSNQKLLRLHTLLTDAKARFGTREKLIGSILDIEKRSKDGGYKSRLENYPLPRLLDLHGSLTRSESKRTAKAEAKKKPPATVAEKAKKTVASAAKAVAKKASAVKKALSKRPPAKKSPAKKSRKG